MTDLETLHFESYAYGSKQRVRCLICRKTYKRSGYYMKVHFDEHEKKGEHMLEEPSIIEKQTQPETISSGRSGKRLTEEIWRELKAQIDTEEIPEQRLAKELKRSVNTLNYIRKSVSYEHYMKIAREAGLRYRKKNGTQNNHDKISGQNHLSKTTHKIDEVKYKRLKELLFTGMSDAEASQETGISTTTIWLIRKSTTLEEYRKLASERNSNKPKPNGFVIKTEVNRYARLRELNEKVVSSLADIFVDEMEIARQVVEKENGEEIHFLKMECHKLQKRAKDLEDKNERLQQKIDQLQMPDIANVVQQKMENRRLLTETTTTHD